MVEFRIGDILDSDCYLICHQVNCQGVMGAGLARQVRAKYPEVYSQYTKYCYGKYRPGLLGTVQAVKVSPDQYVCNLFGQCNYGTDKRYTDYDAVRKALRTIAHYFPNRTVAIPYKMGCNLGGGDWPTVLSIIEDELKNCRVYIYKRA